jgi:hypothetical protein
MVKPVQWPVKEDQFLKIPEYREKWLRFILGNRQASYLESPSEVTSDIQWLYKESHLPVPQQIVIANSPTAYSNTISRLRGHSDRRSGRFVQVGAKDVGVGPSIESGAWGNVYHTYTESVRRLVVTEDANAIHAELRDGVSGPLLVFFNSIFNQWRNVWSREPPALGLLSDGPWLAEADFYEQVCGITPSEGLKKYTSFLKKGVFQLATFSHTAVIMNAPKEIYLNDEFRPHSMSKPAITWRDGTKNYYLHGVRFPEDLWKKVTERKLTAKETMAVLNIEHRTIALRIIGYDKVLQEIGAKVIAKKDVITQPTGRLVHYEVIEADLRDDSPWVKARFVRVQCPSTGKETVIRVDPTANTNTVDGAVAWTFGLRPEQYNPELET